MKDNINQPTFNYGTTYLYICQDCIRYSRDKALGDLLAKFQEPWQQAQSTLPLWSVVEDILAFIFPGITTSLDLALFTLLAPSPYITPINLFLVLPQKNSYLNWNPFSREVEWIELLNRPWDASGFDLTARKYAHIFPLTKLIIFYFQYDITCRGELFKPQGGLFSWWLVQK